MATKHISALPLIVIAGPTASGKTRLAIEVAKEYGGEIICADSRTIYKDLNIGTAKPSRSEQACVPHWGLDLVEPGEVFTAADFQRYAQQKINEIRQRGKIPFLVGGTGLYIDAIIFDYKFGTPVDPEFRRILEDMPIEDLYRYCVKNNVTLPENSKNKRYVIRAIEQKGVNTSRRDTLLDNCFIVGITTNTDVLRSRITLRIEQILEDGVVEEATMLGKKYGWDSIAMTGNIYPIIKTYLLGEITLDELKAKSTTQDWRLAKRQLTWLRRNPHLNWYQLDAAKRYIRTQLVKHV